MDKNNNWLNKCKGGSTIECFPVEFLCIWVLLSPPTCHIVTWTSVVRLSRVSSIVCSEGRWPARFPSFLAANTPVLTYQIISKVCRNWIKIPILITWIKCVAAGRDGKQARQLPLSLVFRVTLHLTGDQFRVSLPLHRLLEDNFDRLQHVRDHCEGKWFG